MRGRHNQRRYGFTIVELLIVIVVIGILAAIVIVAYNGTQQRARNAQRISSAKQWQKIILAYTTTNSAYPGNLISGGSHTCLGTGNETNWDANPNEDCAWSNNSKHPDVAVNSGFQSVFGTLPANTADRLKISFGGATFAGGYSIRAGDTILRTDGTAVAKYPTLLYWLEGNNQDCVLRPVVVSSPALQVSDTASFTYNDGASTFCRIALPEPATL